LTNHNETSARSKKEDASLTEANDALRQAQEFMSEASGPPESHEDQERLTSTLHALDHASRLAEVAGEKGELRSGVVAPEDIRAAELCAEAMRNGVLIANRVDVVPEAPDQEGSGEQAVIQLEQCAKALSDLQQVHRKVTLGSVASGTVSAEEAIARVDAVRRLESLTRHTWRSAAHLVSPSE
jgi:phosphate:Na+ symporter